MWMIAVNIKGVVKNFEVFEKREVGVVFQSNKGTGNVTDLIIKRQLEVNNLGLDFIVKIIVVKLNGFVFDTVIIINVDVFNLIIFLDQTLVQVGKVLAILVNTVQDGIVPDLILNIQGVGIFFDLLKVFKVVRI